MHTAPWDQKFERTVRAALPYLEPDEPLLPATSLTDCGLDSMGMIQLTEVLERTYGVSFPPGTMPTTAFSSAGTLWGAVQTARVTQQLDAADGSGGRRSAGSAGGAAARAGHLAQPWLP
ncbi:acyl carrier protein [Streptacidiphilus neutrinimicus]|uniref:acyl carrier protein n=1 Tax=Streptacidiphilus neutrinimicus TaxID=105420 RepID=UPI00069343F5|nr:acyl carrier protein [Streptacidiphilus neutrinimicus]